MCDKQRGFGAAEGQRDVPRREHAGRVRAQGPARPAGTTILSGQVPPGIAEGVGGDYYIDNATHFLYGPAARHCPPYPCRTLWGKGISLVGPAGPASTSPAGGTAYQVTGFANMPSGD